MPRPTTNDESRRRQHEAWLQELTSLPTAAGHERHVVAWIDRWVATRRNLSIRRDRAGNLIVAQKPRAAAGGARRPSRAPLLITAHLDHPAFVVIRASGRDVELEFRGGVLDPYFEAAHIEIIGSDGIVHTAHVASLNAAARPFKRVIARLDRDARLIVRGDIGRWALADSGPLPRVSEGLLFTRACDDLAGVAAALAAMDTLRRRRDTDHVSLLFTRAEEVGFIGAIAACQARSIPARARLICLETSRSFPESPLGAGPIVRVGDRTSVFDPSLTNAISALMAEYQRSRPDFIWQRRLMPGGTCEATAFGAFGHLATCLCLPLGNYHNMMDIDGVSVGAPAVVGPEFISVSDFHGLVEMLIVCATRLDAQKQPNLRTRMEALMQSHGHVLG